MAGDKIGTLIVSPVFRPTFNVVLAVEMPFQRHMPRHPPFPDGQEILAMETYKLVMPENLNPFGYLFGGQLLKWVDEAAYIAARMDYPACEFVTVAMDRLKFNERVNMGDILRFDVHRTRIGTTSVNYVATVYNALTRQNPAQEIFSTCVTFVHIGADGNKQPLPFCQSTRTMDPASGHAGS